MPIDLPSTRGLGTNVRFELSEAACSVGLSVQSLEDWPIWPWLVEGLQVDISVWNAGDGRGVDPLWIVLRDITTGYPLMSVYQLNGALLRSGQVREELGLDVNIGSPVCESSEVPLLVYVHELEVSAAETTIRLPIGAEGSLPASGAPFSWKVQTGVLVNTFGHLVGPGDAVFDVQYGEFFQFVAWTEPR